MNRNIANFWGVVPDIPIGVLHLIEVTSLSICTIIDNTPRHVPEGYNIKYVKFEYLLERVS